MSWSLNELEALARKAARGRGMSWGLAEEAGRAARILCAWGLDGGEALARLIVAQDGAPHDAVCPLPGADPWQAAGGALCPIAAGCALNDFAGDLRAAPIRMRDVREPVLLIPFAHDAARQLGRPVALDFGAMRLCATADGFAALGDPAALPEHAEVAASLPEAPFGTPLPRHARAALTERSAAILHRFAHRTYAPATEASRLSGAGAGLSDND